MRNNYIRQQISRGNRNLLITNVIILGIIALIAFANMDYLYNFALGPFAQNCKQLSAIGSLDITQTRWVRVQSKRVYPTGLRHVVRRYNKRTNRTTSKKVTAVYYQAVVGRRLLLIKATSQKKKAQYTGELVKIPRSLYRRFVAKRSRRSRRLYLPFMLKEDDSYRTNGYIWLAVLAPFFLLALWNLKAWASRNGNGYRNHPSYEALKAYGMPEDVMMQINGEVSQGDLFELKDITVTPSWMLQQGTYGVDVYPVENIVWTYKQVTKHSVNFIPTGKTYAVKFFLRDGTELQVDCKEHEVETIIVNLLERAPWALVGFHDDLQVLWNSDRNGFIAQIDERRREIEAEG